MLNINNSIIILIPVIILAGLILGDLTKKIKAKNKSEIWSPISIIDLIFFYYCIWPNINPEPYIGYDVQKIALVFNIGALLSYVSIRIGFLLKANYEFTRWNSFFTEKNAKKIGITLFIIGIMCYVPLKGFHVSFVATSEASNFSAEGIDFYFVNAISLFCASCSLLLINWKYHKMIFLVILWLSVVTYLVCGFRFRIVILIISMVTMYNLYPIPKKLNYIPLAVLAICVYLGFAIIDHTRSYNNGININAAKELSIDDIIGGSTEANHVRGFSIMSMDAFYNSGDRVYFAPIINALCMPIPRAIFPRKPNAEYLRYIQKVTINDSVSGSTYLNFAESFIAFGWIGIIVNGLLIGVLSKLFWSNYKRNANSIGAILALGIYNGLVYIIISRGYIAQEFSSVLYFLYLPFWLTIAINKFSNKTT